MWGQRSWVYNIGIIYKVKPLLTYWFFYSEYFVPYWPHICIHVALLAILDCFGRLDFELPIKPVNQREHSYCHIVCEMMTQYKSRRTNTGDGQTVLYITLFSWTSVCLLCTACSPLFSSTLA